MSADASWKERELGDLRAFFVGFDKELAMPFRLAAKSSVAGDKYETPHEVIDAVVQFVPSPTRIWEPFRGSGASTRYLRTLKRSVLRGSHKDFFQQRKPPSDSVLVSNPPFSLKQEVLQHLAHIGVDRFALLLPLEVLGSQYLAHFLGERRIQLIFIRPRVRFLSSGGRRMKKPFPFVCAWFCVGMGLPKDLIFIEAKAAKSASAH